MLQSQGQYPFLIEYNAGHIVATLQKYAQNSIKVYSTLCIAKIFFNANKVRTRFRGKRYLSITIENRNFVNITRVFRCRS